MKKIFPFIILLFLIAFVSAEVNLSTFGFEGIELNDSSKKLCETVIVEMPVEENLEGILTIYSDLGFKSENSYVSVKVNNKEQHILWSEFFKCGNLCSARLFIPELKKGKTSIELCLRTGGNTKSAKIFSSSKIGFYNTPILKIENTSPKKIFLGERAQMKIIVSNSGTKAANIFVQFIAEDLRTLLEITSFDIVEGDTQARFVLEPNSKKEFIYYIKPSLVSLYNLPSAVLNFTNIFGEEQQIYSNHPQLNVLNPNQIDLLLISEGISENKFNFKIKINNNWDIPFNGELIMEPNDLIKNYLFDLNLKPFEKKEIDVSTSSLRPGNYSILVKIDSNKGFFSDSFSFVVEKTDFLFEIIFSLIALIVSIGIFIKIYFF